MMDLKALSRGAKRRAGAGHPFKEPDGDDRTGKGRDAPGARCMRPGRTTT